MRIHTDALSSRTLTLARSHSFTTISYQDLMANDMLRFAFSGLLDRTDLDPKEVDYVLAGTVIQEPKTSNIAREVCISTPRFVPRVLQGIRGILGSVDVSCIRKVVRGAFPCLGFATFCARCVVVTKSGPAALHFSGLLWWGGLQQASRHARRAVHLSLCERASQGCSVRPYVEGEPQHPGRTRSCV